MTTRHQCRTQEEIAGEVGLAKTQVNEICSEYAKLQDQNKFNFPENSPEPSDVERSGSMAN